MEFSVVQCSIVKCSSRYFQLISQDLCPSKLNTLCQPLHSSHYQKRENWSHGGRAPPSDTINLDHMSYRIFLSKFWSQICLNNLLFHVRTLHNAYCTWNPALHCSIGQLIAMQSSPVKWSKVQCIKASPNSSKSINHTKCFHQTHSRTLRRMD